MSATKRAKNLIGRKFGKLTVIGKAESLSSKNSRWNCECECGGSTTTQAGCLESGMTQSCGCLRIDKFNQRVAEITGKVFGRLTVESAFAKEKKEPYKGGFRIKKLLTCNCLCECGNRTMVLANLLKSGNTKSCGCICNESHPVPWLVPEIKHGLTRKGDEHARERSIYNCWFSMIDRCTNPSHEFYHRYGGRGISVCHRWASNIQNFIDDMGLRPWSGAEIDRIDNNGNYEPENCKWSTRKQQCRNTERSLRVEFEGKSVLLIELAERFGIKYDTL